MIKVISTNASEEQQKKDMPELKRLNAIACEEDMMWQFFGGTITTQEGNVYQVIDSEGKI